MARNRFVVPENTRLQLSDGDWIEVKKQLNVGEQKQLEAAGVTRSALGPPIIDWQEYQIGRAAVWITDWSFADETGKQREFSVEALKAVDVDTFQEIQAALNAHIEAGDKKKVSPTS